MQLVNDALKIVIVLIAALFILSLFNDLGYTTGNAIKLKEISKISLAKKYVTNGEVLKITIDGGYWGVEKNAALYKGTFLKGKIAICEKAPCKGINTVYYTVPDNAPAGIYTIKVYNYNSYIDDRLEARFTVQPVYAFTAPSNKP